MAIPAGGVVGPVREPGNVSLLCPKLTTTNYTAWSIMMETVLAAHGLQDAIDPVTGGGVDARRKNMAKALIFQSIPEDVLLQVSKYQEPKDVWDAIRTVDEFAGRLSGIQSKYRSLGSSLEEEVMVRKFLNSMPPKYLPIVASIEQYSEIENMAFEEVVGRLKAYEERVKPQEDLARDVREKLLLVHNDKQVKEKKGRCGLQRLNMMSQVLPLCTGSVSKHVDKEKER
ncbi:hypothetical protein E3N88_23977 [Mikania micrantha]|uniref:DUF4219 domain-containing protein n=1 Tax=Mikania micrantha TaxID=192012 RepID=A0A5N6NER8_9ASTR|nr:hypothetical protein E3N88_23977 [Mikania micrantha]